MPRHNSGMDEIVFGSSKIIKRASSFSSTSSSLLQNYRFKRAIMVGTRCGSTTPAPNWRMNPRSPSVGSKVSESSRQQGPVSARKLANALWELNRIPSPKFSDNLSTRRSRKIPQARSHRLSDPSHSPDSERSENSRYIRHRRIMPVVSQRVRSKEHDHRALDFISSASRMEIVACSQVLTPTSSTTVKKSRLKDLRNGLTSSKELLKVVSRIWGREDRHSYVISLFSALRVELDRARTQVDHLIQEQKLEHNEISCLKKQFMEEKSSWKIREQERIKSTVHSIMEELESEKKLRIRAERLNKKLGSELTNTRGTLSKAVKELEKEKEMLQLADEWREERVQMKLSEAKVQFEEKNAAVDQLRNELKAFLQNKKIEEETQFDEKRFSVESDLRSIELNMESNKPDNWSYGPKVEEKDEDVERYVSVKKLRDHMLAGTKIVLPRSSPTRQWNRNRNSHDSTDRACEGLKVAEIVKAIKERRIEGRRSVSNSMNHS